MDHILLERMMIFGESALHHFWLPLIWWTCLVGLVMLAYRYRSSSHPFFDYYFRVALIIAFPTALLLSWLIPVSGSIISMFSPASTSNFYMVSVPIPNFVISAQSASINATSMLNLHSVLALLTSILIGIALLKTAIVFKDLLSLRNLKQKLHLQWLSNHSMLNARNYKAASESTSDVLIATANVGTPFTFGWFTPIIVIPNHLQNNHSTFNLIVAHELVHIRRHDYRLNLVLSLIKALLGFHPLVSYLLHQINDFRETSCDQEVITEFQASPAQYAKLIFSVSQASGHQSNLQIALTEQSSNLKKRIQTMSMNTTKPSKALNLLGIALIGIAITFTVACTETSSQINVPDNQAETPPVLNLEQIQSQDYQIYIDGTLTDVGSLDEAIATEKIGSIRIDNSGQSKKIFIKSKQAQTNDNTNTDGELFNAVEQMPEPKGGIIELMKKINYPEEARKAGIEGRVIVQFIVDKNGNVQNPQVIQGIGGGCDEEALRVIKSTVFTPGQQRGQDVNVKMTMPVVFRLQ